MMIKYLNPSRDKESDGTKFFVDMELPQPSYRTISFLWSAFLRIVL